MCTFLLYTIQVFHIIFLQDQDLCSLILTILRLGMEFKFLMQVLCCKWREAGTLTGLFIASQIAPKKGEMSPFPRGAPHSLLAVLGVQVTRCSDTSNFYITKLFNRIGQNYFLLISTFKMFVIKIVLISSFWQVFRCIQTRDKGISNKYLNIAFKICLYL